MKTFPTKYFVYCSKGFHLFLFMVHEIKMYNFQCKNNMLRTQLKIQIMHTFCKTKSKKEYMTLEFALLTENTIAVFS